ncbi:Chalcone isomerase [Oxalobacteraceae bacterium]
MTAIYQRIFFLALVAFLLPLAAYGQPSPGYVRQALPEATLVGQGMFRWFGLSVYKARLWGDKAKVTATGWPASSFALELEYTRKIEGEDIAIASIDEIKKLGLGTNAQHDQWLAEMKKLFPNVDEGHKLTGIFIPEQASRFFLDGKPIGEIDDPEFGPAFFSIWLHPKTSAPKLRRLLLNTK